MVWNLISFTFQFYISVGIKFCMKICFSTSHIFGGIKFCTSHASHSLCVCVCVCLVALSGGRTSNDIVAWLKKKTGPPAKSIEDEAAAKAFSEAHSVVVVGHFADQSSADAKAFLEAAAAIESVPFGISSSSDVASHLKLNGDGVVMLKDFDEGRREFSGEISHDGLKEFVNSYSLPLVIEFTDEVSKRDKTFDKMHFFGPSSSGKDSAKFLSHAICPSFHYHLVPDFFLHFWDLKILHFWLIRQLSAPPPHPTPSGNVKQDRRWLLSS